MPRIRTIKPDFFTSDTVSSLPLRARLTWIGLWTHCDDYGRCRDNVKLVKAAVWPLDDVSLRDVAEDLNVLAAAGVIRKYAVEGRHYIQVTGWDEHQKVDRPSKSPIPGPQPVDKQHNNSSAHAREPSTNTREPSTVRSEPPPLRCPKHLDDPDPPPCGQCADARKAWERWDAARGERERALPRCRKHPTEFAHNCRTCRSEALAGDQP